MTDNDQPRMASLHRSDSLGQRLDHHALAVTIACLMIIGACWIIFRIPAQPEIGDRVIYVHMTTLICVLVPALMFVGLLLGYYASIVLKRITPRGRRAKYLLISLGIAISLLSVRETSEFFLWWRHSDTFQMEDASYHLLAGTGLFGSENGGCMLLECDTGLGTQCEIVLKEHQGCIAFSSSLRQQDGAVQIIGDRNTEMPLYIYEPGSADHD